MTDILIRDVSPDVVAALDAIARRLGLSRAEYLKRQLAQAARSAEPVAQEDLEWFGDTFADLDDPGLMGKAWE
ncbi:antitoxin [Pseudonocardia sp. MH-G8]|uniref:type II toxin-antitoxin system VapB family antitoxin n=1 Tax=Pseudonocardia sp. MH-G8 TaxID=1854588 RepID=UPI000BA085FA|nr:antitoxin [Pseudonocardia sp. MH-G8]OZM77796.1 antitoxin [Pseudonocardia sp. MH-G8]